MNNASIYNRPESRTGRFSHWLGTALLLACLAPLPNLAQAAPVEPGIEHRLDDYINEITTDPSSSHEELYAAIRNEIDEETPIGTRIRALGYGIVFGFAPDNADAALEEIEAIIAEAEAGGYPGPIAEAIAYKIQILWYMEKAADALLLAPALEGYLAQTESPRIRYYGHNLLARLLRQHSRYEDALDHFLAAYRAVEETDDSRSLLRRQFLNLNIAQLHAELNNLPRALEIADRAIEDALAHGLDFHLPGIYLLKGHVASRMEEWDAAIRALEQAIAWARKVGNSEALVMSLNSLGTVYLGIERYEEARAALEQALIEILDQEAPEAPESTVEHAVRLHLARLAIMQGNHEEGVAQLERSYDLLRQRYSDADLAELLTSVAEAYVEAGELEKAVAALIEQRELNTKVFKAERDRRIRELQTRYETVQQADQIRVLEQRNELQQQVIDNERRQQRHVILFVVFVLAAIALLWFAYLRLGEANRKLAYQSAHDDLTGLLNRRSFQDEMRKRDEQGGERRTRQHPDALVLLDVDAFKEVNDCYGHSAGDAVLEELARRLTEVSRNTDSVIRWGGEEMLLYLRDMDPAFLPQYVGRILEKVAGEPFQCGRHEIPLSMTGGFIPLPLDGLEEKELDWERALHIADMALYIGKSTGRNRAIGVIGLNVPLEDVRDSLSTDLAGAIEDGNVESVTIHGPDQR